VEKEMDTLCINGGSPLQGVLPGQVSKNAFIPILAASTLCEEEVCLQNAPEILDVDTYCKIMKSIGIKTNKQGNDLLVKADSIHTWEIPPEFDQRARGIILMLGAIGARLGRVKLPYPGGCKIGDRKLDAHLEVMKGMGFEVKFTQDAIVANQTQRGVTTIPLSFPSVSATLLALIMASRRTGQTVLSNTAREPEIVDLVDFLNGMGAKIRGAGSSTITITGIDELKGINYEAIPDRIVSGTYLVASALVGERLRVTKIRLHHLSEVITQLKHASIDIHQEGDYVEARCNEITPVNITTAVYPGFPTDLQPIFSTLATFAKGTSTIRETLYNNRFAHVNELQKMGAKITQHDDTISIQGVEHLQGAPVRANDLRAGAALVLAGLAAEGTTKIQNISQVDRGYDNLDIKLTRIGADIWRE
jgi:UDP-N-acetylglucosamine 1-carboxyvinyltransferase